MKLYAVFFFLLFTLKYSAFADQLNNNTRKSIPVSSSDLHMNSIKDWSFKNLQSQNSLKKIKYNLVMGNLDYAKILISEASLSVNFTKPIQYRYLATIHFIEGNYLDVIKILNKPEMLDFSVQPKVCFLKVLSYIILDQKERASLAWKICQQATRIYSKTNLAWMEIIVKLKTSKDKKYISKLFDGLVIDNLDNSFLRIYLKLALYLNTQDKIIPRFKFFGSSPLENEIQRELIGLNYYRNGDLLKAFQLLEHLDTANAEVVKGNIYLYQKKFEYAYGQYKLALKKKSNSRNALGRLIPLAWKLNQYQDGLQFLQRIDFSKEDTEENYTLMSVFLTLSGKHKSAKKYLERVIQLSNGAEPVDISEIKVLNGLKLQNFNNTESSAANSCNSRNGLSCWFNIALNSWEGLVDELHKSDLIHSKMVNLEELYSSKLKETPIKEDLLLNQKTIEELDNDLIDLIIKKELEP